MNQPNTLNQTTTILLNITALLAVIVLANWLWTLAKFSVITIENGENTRPDADNQSFKLGITLITS